MDDRTRKLLQDVANTAIWPHPDWVKELRVRARDILEDDEKKSGSEGAFGPVGSSGGGPVQ